MIIHNPILTGSFTVNGTDVASITSSAASITSLNAYTASQNILNGTYATTGSNTFAGIQTVNSNLVVTGSITAQTLIVSTINATQSYSSGSNIFGNSQANTQTFTGSMSVSGSAVFSEQLTATSPSTLFKEGFIVKATTTGGGGSQPAYTYYTAAGSKRWSSFLNVGDDKLHIANALNSEVFTIIQSGSVGIGTTSPSYLFDITKESDSNTSLAYIKNTAAGRPAYLSFKSPAYNFVTGIKNDVGYVIANNDGTISSNSQINFCINSSGNVGINQSSPRSFLEISKTTGNTSLGVPSNVSLTLSQGGVLNEYSQIGFGYTTSNSSPAVIGFLTTDAAAYTKGALIFATRDVTTDSVPTERMRITSGGAVFINTTSALPGSGTLLHVDSPTAGPSFKNAASGQQTLMLWNAVSSGDNLFLEFNVNTSIVGKGSVDYNRASNVTRYNTTSDANLKNIIGDSNKQKSIDILNSTKIKEFSWKEDETNKSQIGVIAQELYETFKGAVSVGSDKELLGTEDYKSWKVDKTAFTFHLIAGWQKHEQIIQELQAQITELKNK